MNKYGMGFAFVLLAQTGAANAGGYDSEGFAHHYFNMSKSEGTNLSFFERQCRSGRDPLHFRKNIPETYGFVLKDVTGERRHKLIPLASHTIGVSPNGRTRRVTFLDLESGIARIITKTFFVDDKWKHENVVRVKWLDGVDGTLGSVVVDLKPVSNSFRIHPIGYSKGNDLCSRLTGLALAQRLGGPTYPVIAREQPYNPSIKIEITR